jgi:hypothetical protein
VAEAVAQAAASGNAQAAAQAIAEAAGGETALQVLHVQCMCAGLAETPLFQGASTDATGILLSADACV